MRVSKRRSHDTRRGRRTLQKAREHATPAKRTMKTTVKKMLTRMPTCKKERSASLPSFLLAMLLTNTTTTRESQSVEGTDGREPFDLEQWVERSANFCNVVWQVKPRYSRFFLFFFGGLRFISLPPTATFSLFVCLFAPSVLLFIVNLRRQIGQGQPQTIPSRVLPHHYVCSPPPSQTPSPQNLT
jgi:hypothetical protein